MKTPRLPHTAIEANFNQWASMLWAHESISRQSKQAFLPKLRRERHVIIVDMHQVYKDGVGAALNSDYPFVITTKASPFALLDCHATLEDAIEFCESIGVTWDIHIYPDTSTALH